MSEADTDKLIHDLHAVVRDAEELLCATTGLAGEHITQARAKAESSLRSAREMLQAMGKTTAAHAQEAVRRTDRYVHGNPWVAVGIGATVGFVIGMLAGRRPGRAD